MQSIYNKVALFLTHRCNAYCDICCYSCGPEKKAHLPWDVAEQVIREAGAMPEMKSLLLSGGEAWLYRDEVLACIRLAHSLGLHTMLYTNGFWGKDTEAARQAATEMRDAGLDIVRFSADPYHQKFIPPAHLRNALQAALEVQMECELSIIEFDEYSTLSWAKETLGEDLVQSPVKVLSYPAIPAGRAKENIPREKFSRIFPPVLLPPCSFTGMIQLSPAGNWYPCCGISCMDLPQLIVGNVREMSLREVESRALANDFLKIILLEGWAWIWLKARELGQPLPERVTMFCECCSFLFSRPDLMAAMSEAAHLHAAELSL